MLVSAVVIGMLKWLAVELHALLSSVCVGIGNGISMSIFGDSLADLKRRPE